VRSGDSLGKIANRNGCTVDQLVAWNRLRNTVIQPGQKLTIRK
jgi:LysM repeat protein